MTHFDDYLDLGSADFSRDRLVVFTGRSGSGKSTAIQWLLAQHPHLRDRERVVLHGPPFEHLPPRGTDVAVVEELVHPRDLFAVVRLLGRARTLLVASHLCSGWFHPLALAMKTSMRRTDRDPGKLARYLERQGIHASEDAVRRFVRLFGATYTDVDLVLERYPAESFDTALARFTKFCTIRLGPNS